MENNCKNVIFVAMSETIIKRTQIYSKHLADIFNKEEEEEEDDKLMFKMDDVDNNNDFINVSQMQTYSKHIN